MAGALDQIDPRAGNFLRELLRIDRRNDAIGIRVLQTRTCISLDICGAQTGLRIVMQASHGLNQQPLLLCLAQTF